MTSGERENFCNLMAGLFAPPEGGIGHLRRQAASFVGGYAMEYTEGEAQSAGGFSSPDPGEVIFSELDQEYRRLFSGPGPCVSLIESSYKPWTNDPECRVSFAREKDLLMGDSALHMAALFRSAGLDLPGEFGACPDHLVLELEFLGVLYRAATDREVKLFLDGHLDWISELKEKLMGFHPHPFYRRAVEALDVFLCAERDRLEREENG